MMSTIATRRMAPLAVCFSALTVSCALEEGRPNDPLASCAEGVVSRLYVGQTTPTGVVTEAEWRVFITESLTPRFPAGFTELRAHGHWRDDRGTVIEEDTRIIEIVHDGTPRNRERVRAVAADYKSRFAQQSVLITQAQSSHCF